MDNCGAPLYDPKPNVNTHSYDTFFNQKNVF